MPDRHVEALFAPACDGALERAARRRFDDHLASCGRCAAGFADHCAASEAVRGLPPARMPVPVRIPMHAPGVGSAGGVVEFLRSRRALPLALGGITAAAAAVIVAVALHGGGGGSSPALQAGGGVAQGPTAAAGSQDSAATVAPAAGAVVPAPANGLGPQQRASVPVANAVRVERSGRPGEVLVVTTDRRCYAPGSQVTVVAGLLAQSVADALVPSAPASPAAQVAAPVAPCAAEGAPAGSAVPPLAPNASLGTARFLAVPSTVLLLASAPPPGAAGVDGSPSPVAVAQATAAGSAVFTVTVPPTARPGDVLDIVATVSSGVPITAILQITVG